MSAARSQTILLTAAALVVILAGLKAAASLIVPFLLALFLAIICLPAMNALIRHKVPESLAVLLITLSLLAIAGLVTAFAGASVADFSQNLPTYQSKLKGEMGAFITWLSDHGVSVSSAALLDQFDPAAAMGMAGKLLAGLGNALANTLLIVLMVIFLLFEAMAIPHKWAFLGNHAPSSDGIHRFIASVNRYLVIKTIVSFGTGVAVTLLLWAIGVDYPILWGLLAFLFNFVPNIGSIIAAIPPLLLALVQLGGESAIYVGIGYIAINMVVGNVIEPRFMGRGVGLSTLIVFLSLVFWGWLLGPVGMLLSVPLTMIVKIALETREDTRWIAVLLGPDMPAPKAEQEKQSA
jgi:predicted PurR-regulated permease PerM